MFKLAVTWTTGWTQADVFAGLLSGGVSAHHQGGVWKEKLGARPHIVKRLDDGGPSVHPTLPHASFIFVGRNGQVTRINEVFYTKGSLAKMDRSLKGSSGTTFKSYVNKC